MIYYMLGEKPNGNRPLWYVDVSGRILLKLLLEA